MLVMQSRRNLKHHGKNIRCLTRAQVTLLSPTLFSATVIYPLDNIIASILDLRSGENPVPLEIDPPAFPDGSRFKLPIAIMASNRPSYLLRMLLGMQKVHGLDTSMMTVFIDGFWPEPASITRLLGVNLEQHAGVSRRNARICQVQ